MPNPRCHLCGHKWEVIGGGLCQACRTLDRLCAIVRGPEVPAGAEFLVLQRLRTWVGELQDLGELSRGVAPNPVQAAPPGQGGDPPGGAASESLPAEEEVEEAPKFIVQEESSQA